MQASFDPKSSGHGENDAQGGGGPAALSSRLHSTSSVSLGRLSAVADDEGSSFSLALDTPRHVCGGEVCGLTTLACSLGRPQCLLRLCSLRWLRGCLCGSDDSEEGDYLDAEGLLGDGEPKEAFRESDEEGQMRRVRGRRRAEGHRGYRPPRSRGEDEEHSLTASALSRLGDGSAGSDSLSGSAPSFTTDTSSSAVTLTRWDTFSGKERWVMRQGVLARIGPDGVAEEATDSQVRRLHHRHGGRHGTQGGGDGVGGAGQLRTEDQYDAEDAARGEEVFLEGTHSPLATAARPSHRGVADPTGAETTAAEEVERLRAPVYTLEQLSSLLDRCAAHLPVRVEVTAEGAPGNYTLHIVGPLQPSEQADVLGVLEDIVLDDCDEGSLCMAGLHISDVCFTSRGGGAAEVGRHRAHSNAFLDMLPSLRDDDELSAGAVGDDEAGRRRGTPFAGTGAPRSTEARTGIDASPSRRAPVRLTSRAVKECEMRFLAFVKNLMENRAHSLQTVRLTRCLFTPLDLGSTLPLPLKTLRHLVFEQCPLTPAHVDALLVLARAGSRQRRGGPSPSALPTFDRPNSNAEAKGVAIAGTALGNVSELQLSGALTEDAVGELLSYLQDEAARDGRRPALKILRVPSLLVRAAREHALVETHPFIQVLPAR